jgi:hypothetical protein
LYPQFLHGVAIRAISSSRRVSDLGANNFPGFSPLAKVVQVFSDANEMEKEFPKIDLKIVSYLKK